MVDFVSTTPSIQNFANFWWNFLIFFIYGKDAVLLKYYDYGHGQAIVKIILLKFPDIPP